MNLEGKFILITGASQGFGKAVAGACLDAGASVFLCARNAGPLADACADLARCAKPNRKVLSRTADVSRAKEVDELFEAVLSSFDHLDGVVNNAGVYGPMGASEEVDWEEWVRAIEINLMGTVLPCRAAISHFRAKGRGKIVNLSGGGATAPLPRLSSYAASKAAVVRFTETLAHETRDFGIDVNAIAPGALNTRMLEQVLAAGPKVVGEAFYQRALKQKEEGGTAFDKGAQLCVFLLSDQSDGVTGRLISALWDPWQTLPNRRRELAETDVYTLRRIVPGDRGLDWGELK